MKKLLILLLLLIPTISFSQKEAAIWYFGQYAGLDFNSGAPVVLTNGQVNTFEGCATISDSTGNLLFYTDGVIVWDKSHSIMPNGRSLLGNTSSTQSAIIIPRPNNTDQYYIFTVDDNPTGLSSNGIHYSTVNLILNGGMGDVVTTEKNIPVIDPAFEKITATKHSNGNSYWVITFIRNQYYSYLVDATGVNLTPIISTVSTSDGSIGYLKTAPNGSKIACANYGATQSLRLYDFNTTTGIVTNEIQLTLDNPEDIPYGVEFSPSSEKLYVETDQNNASGRIPPSKIIQYDLTSASISNSRVLIHTSPVNTRGALQLAIDGKIYRACSVSLGRTQIGTPFLGVINNPEGNGLACNYVHDALDISNGDSFRKSVEGLPPFISSFFVEPSISANNVCFGTATEFFINSTSTPSSIRWNFGDPLTGTDNTSTNLNPTHLFSVSGIFTITASVIIGSVTTNLSIDVTIFDAPIVNSPVFLIQCDDDLDGFVDFNLEEVSPLISANYINETITYYTDSLAATTSDAAFLIANPTIFSNTTTSTVWARVENATNCSVIAEVNLQVASTDIPTTLMLPFYECDDASDGDATNEIATFDFSAATNQVLNALLPNTGFTITYYETMTEALAEQNAIDPTNYTNTTATTQQIVVRADDINNECFGIGFHITLNIETIPEFDLPTTTSFCKNKTPKTIGIENPAATYTYEWEDELGNSIGTTQNINITTIGLYTVTATGLSGATCSNSKTIQITFNPSPIVNSPVSLIQCDDNLDGFVDFNLEEANPLISANYLNETISYYTDSLAAATSDTAFLITNLTTFSNATIAIVWARVENTTNCAEVAEVNLQVTNTDIPATLMLPFYECATTNGIATFDFSTATNQILNALLPNTEFTITYYETMAEALAEQNAIDATNYTNTSATTQQIVVRADDINNECFGIGFHVTLNVTEIPKFDLASTKTICFTSNNTTIGIENPQGTYNYLWKNEVGTVIGNTPDISVSEQGLYSVTATIINGITCAQTKSIQVENKPAEVLPNFGLDNIEIKDNSTNNTITVLTTNLPISNYEYALDTNDFQVNNVFENVISGSHIVKIRALNNCLEAAVEVSVISIPNFFTPNNDGYNDTWHVTGIEFQPTSNIYIFDRFGKLIVILDPLGPGWDGNYKGNPLPSTDYWYKVELENGRTLKGHFSLIRR